MPSFKPKCDKKLKFNVTPVTLDDKHQHHIDTFKQNNVEKIPTMKQKIISLKSEHKACKQIEKKLEIVDKIVQLKEDIRKLKK